MSGNAQDKERSGRVYITYDVHTGGAKQQRELPFVVGVIGDFAGHKKMPAISDRPFVDVDRRNINTVMGSIRPELNLTFTDGPSQHLAFSSLADFEPERLADQMPEVKALKELRVRLRELLTKANRSDDLAEQLRKAIEPGVRDAIDEKLQIAAGKSKPRDE